MNVPAVLGPNRQGFAEVLVRESASGGHKRVVDIFVPGDLAVVVCLDCRQKWDEGAEAPEYPMECKRGR